jgi:choline dehydrogenase-like flavoprotein
MRSPRLELTSKAQKSLDSTSAFVHFTFLTQGNTGFDLIRGILRGKQGEVHCSSRAFPITFFRVFKDLSLMLFWRIIHKRLWIPKGSDLLLQVDIEQTPNYESRLFLSEDRDSMGRKKVVIDWRISRDDIDIISRVTQLAISTWNNSKLSKLASLQSLLPSIGGSFDNLYDVYHPTGSIRMGQTSQTSVVNKDLRLWAAVNCFVSSTAIFPSAGSANPGLTHLALTARLAGHIFEKINKTDKYS